jgi:ribosomal protein L11 methyltransferase
MARIGASDLDAQSVLVAAENSRRNRERRRIRFSISRGLSSPEIARRAPFDLLIANILAGPLVALAPALRKAVQRNGTLVLSGLLVPQAPEIIAVYGAHGFRLNRHDRIAGWSTLTLQRR